MNTDYYKKAKGKESQVINLLSDDEDVNENYSHQKQPMFVKNQAIHPQPNREVRKNQNIVIEGHNLFRNSDSQIVVQFDESSQQYSYSYEIVVNQLDSEIKKVVTKSILNNQPMISQNKNDSMEAFSHHNIQQNPMLVEKDENQIRRQRGRILRLKIAQKLAAKGKLK